jgi:hypothetical protein
MNPSILVVAAVVAIAMISEAAVAHARRALRATGQSNPGDVYAVMQVVYRAACLDGRRALARASGALLVPGAIVFAVAKLLKWWAITSLGTR